MAWNNVRDLRVAAETGIPDIPLMLTGRLTGEIVDGDEIDGTPSRFQAGAAAAGFVEIGTVRLDPALGIDVADGRLIASPELGATLRIGRASKAWGRVGKGFRLPTFGDLYFASQYSLRPNPDLEAERVTLDAEIGYGGQVSWGNLRITGSATGWLRHSRDPIIWLSSSTAVWSPQNLGELRASGAEGDLTVEASPGAHGGWRAQLAGSIQKSRVGFGANRNSLPYEPAVAGRLSLQGWVGTVGGRLDVRYTGARTTSIAATRKLPGFLTLDVSARHQLEAGRLGLGLLIRMENVTDQRYQLVELFPEPGRRFSVRLELRSAST
jgi:outer membrane receptor protein involved in Fe transport